MPGQAIIQQPGMNLRALLLSVILLAGPLYARDKTDVLVMNNGDRITCAVKGLEGGVLYVELDYVDGTVSVDWSKVVRVESKQLFYVKTEDGSVYKGTISTPETGGGPARIHVGEESGQEAVIEAPQVVRMTATSENFWKRFDGDITLGVIYSKGNQSTQYSLGSTAEYIRQRWGAKAAFDSSLASSTGVNASHRNFVSLNAYRWLPGDRWYYSGLAAFLQSSEQGIDLQSTLGGGVGRYLTNTNFASVKVLGGVAWQNTSYTQFIVPPSARNVTAAMISANARLFQFSKTNLDATAVLLPALSDPGRVRFNTDVTYYIKLVSNLKWNISFYGNWDNRPPPGLSGSDYGTSSGVSWTFGLR
jgi:putative salt-induced outer membrane protein YdiY